MTDLEEELDPRLTEIIDILVRRKKVDGTLREHAYEVLALIQRECDKRYRDMLNQLVEDARDEMHGTYDFDMIAECVLVELDELNRIAQLSQTKQSKDKERK